MSHNCDCNDNLTILPLRGLAVDASALNSNCDCGPGSGDSLSYSLEEQFTGKYWIDGKKIYQKTIDFGIMPNKAIKQVDCGIAGNFSNIIHISGFMDNGVSVLPLPRSNFDNASPIDCNASMTDKTVRVNTNYNFSAYKAYITILYTLMER